MDFTPPAPGPLPPALTPNFYPGPGFVPQPLPFPVIAVSRDVYHPAWWYGIGDPPVGLAQPTPHAPLQAHPPRLALVPNAASGGATPAGVNDQGGPASGLARQDSALTSLESSTPLDTPPLGTTDCTEPQDTSPPATTTQKRQASVETEHAGPEQKKARAEVQPATIKKKNKTKNKKNVLSVATALSPATGTNNVTSAAQPSTDRLQQSLHSHPSDNSNSFRQQPTPSSSDSTTPFRPSAIGGSLTPTAKPSAKDIAIREQQLRAQLKTKWITPKESDMAITQVKQEPPETPVRSSVPSPPPPVPSQASFPAPQLSNTTASPPPAQPPVERQPHDIDTLKKPLTPQVETAPSIFRSIFSRWRPIADSTTDGSQATKEASPPAAPVSAPESAACKATGTSPVEVVVELGADTTSGNFSNAAIGVDGTISRTPMSLTAQASREADSGPSPFSAALALEIPAVLPSDVTEEDMQISPIESALGHEEEAPAEDERLAARRAGSEALVLREILGEDKRAPVTSDQAASPSATVVASAFGKLKHSTPATVQTDSSLTKGRDGSNPLVITMPTPSTAPNPKADQEQTGFGQSAPMVQPASGVPSAKSVLPPVSEPKSASSSKPLPTALPALAAPRQISPTLPPRPVVAAVPSQNPTAAKSAENPKAGPLTPKLTRPSGSQPASQAIGKGKQSAPTRPRSPPPYSSPLPEPADFRPMKKASLATRLYWEDDHYSPYRPPARRPRSPSLSPPRRGRPAITRPRSPSVSPPPSFKRAEAAGSRSDLKGLSSGAPVKAAEPGSSSTKSQQQPKLPKGPASMTAKPALLQRMQTDGLPVLPQASSLAQIRAGAGVPPKPAPKNPAVWAYSPPPGGSNSSFAKLVLAQSAPAQPSLSSRISGQADAPTSGQSG